MHMISVKDDIFHTQDILCTRDDTLFTLRFEEANEDDSSSDDDDGTLSDEISSEVDSDDEISNESSHEIEAVNDGRIDSERLYSMIFPKMSIALRYPPSSIVIFCTQGDHERHSKRNDNQCM